MGTIDSLSITNWTDTGQTTPVPRWTVDVEINWDNAARIPQQHIQTYTFPNVLQGIPLARLRRYMEMIIMNEARLALAIDTEET